VRSWLDAGVHPVPVSVNVSPRQFRDPHFIDVVVAALRDHDVEPGYLKLEVTESMAADDLDGVIRTLSALRDMGVQILLDDFGTGYSSLSYLTRLPLDKVKIDRAFIQRVTERQHEAAVVSTIIAMGKSLGLGLIAEGVETEGQLRFLHCRGCEEVQGFLFSRPVPATAFATMLGTGNCLVIPACGDG
jgi:EAL domain-containing protein (putative c-di-GMP-specific phosphodiesterase class I)